MLLTQIDALSAQINTLTGRIENLIAELPERRVDHSGAHTDTAAPTRDRPDAGRPQLGAADSPAHAASVDPAIEAECAR